MFYILQWFMQDTHMRPLTVDGYTCSNTLKSHTWPYLLLAPIRRCWSSQVSPLALHGDRCTPIDALMANSHAVGCTIDGENTYIWWEYIYVYYIFICLSKYIFLSNENIWSIPPLRLRHLPCGHIWLVYQIYWSIKLLFAIIAMRMWGRDWSMTTHIWTLLVCH